MRVHSSHGVRLLVGLLVTEGALALSSDRRYLTLAGYGAAPGLPSVVSTPASTTPRVIARIDATGSVDTTTALTDQPSGNNVRGSVTDDGSRFWVTGAAGGVRFAPLGATTSAQVTTTPTNTRVVTVADGQLYISSGSTPFIGVSHVGTGLPAMTATATLLAGATSPYGFVFLPDFRRSQAHERLIDRVRAGQGSVVRPWTRKHVGTRLWACRWT